jgi:NADH-quinone oxidoreductase subunit L
MGRYVLPLEIVALLLTAALIGAVIVALHEKEGTSKMATPLAGYLLVAALLFAIGLAGALTRRNAILVLIGIELMLNAANLNLIAFWRYGPHPEALTGMMFAIFSIAVAAAEAGWVLDPLAAVMLVMVSLVGLLIFIYSLGYMAHDENFTRFFCFLSLFASAMLGLVIANSLLLLFICWEIVGLTSYLLIGFWYHKPSAAAAAKKAFITTRIGDLALLLGMVWLYSQTGTLLFYDAATAVSNNPRWPGWSRKPRLRHGRLDRHWLLIFCGAIGKSGQVPLHVWLPDAMEGPTPVSALIHAATMVAAGVFWWRGCIR